jgi:dipeptidase D
MGILQRMGRNDMAFATANLEPRVLWRYFEEISRIPRASKKEGRVLEYLLRRAGELGIDCRQDDAGNIVMYRPAHSRYSRAPAAVVQSHVDMVCEKNSDSDHDFDRDPIVLQVDGEWVRAKGTSLGADNGIGVASMLSILSDSSLELGPLELLFTVEEEIGLNGARDLAPEMISGRTLINLDTEEVGSLYVGCAGGRDSDLFVPMEAESAGGSLKALKLGVTGLRGGHSGAEIHLGGANALKLLARMLSRLRHAAGTPLRVASLAGGDKHNAIPREAFAVVVVDEAGTGAVRSSFDEYVSTLHGELHSVDPGARFHLDPADLPPKVFDERSSARLVDTVMAIPHGVLAMSRIVEGLVETSSNLSSVRTGGEEAHIHASHRSSVDSALDWMCETHRSIASLSGARIEQDAGYPGWSPDPDSRILGMAKEASQRILGRSPNVRAIHAGLECGVIKGKFEGMDAISIGPTIRGPHSPDERVHIQSVHQFRSILLETLRLFSSRGIRVG